MTEQIETDVCVIGGGAGGLSFAAGAAQMGANVILLEKNKMGGDCLNYGCIPSKALITASRAAQTIRSAERFGVGSAELKVNFKKIRDHIRGVVADIAPHDSEERFQALGVRVIRSHGRFSGPRSIAAGDYEIFAKRIIISTGSAPAIPDISGLDKVPFFTNETIFDNSEPFEHLLVIGGGPIGMELAQAHRRLGAKVTVIEAFKVLANDDSDLAAVVMDRLITEGVDVQERVLVKKITGVANAISIEAERDGRKVNFEGSHLLIAVGRKPNTDDLNLEAAGIDTGPGGIPVNARMQTANKRVYAIGDVVEGHNFTHVAGYHAAIAIRNILFRLPAKADYTALPWVTFTSPELAQVGLTEHSARAKFGDVKVLEADFSENDRAHTEAETVGRLKVITTNKGVVVGASLVGEGAGEIIQSWCLPISKKLKIKNIAGLVLPYPTLGEINKRAAGSYFTPSLFGGRIKALVRFLLSLG